MRVDHEHKKVQIDLSGREVSAASGWRGNEWMGRGVMAGGLLVCVWAIVGVGGVACVSAENGSAESQGRGGKTGRASCRERVCQSVEIKVVTVILYNKKDSITSMTSEFPAPL